MGLPDGLTVEALKRRIDIQKGGDDTLLGEYLEGAVEQAQQPSPLGCGLLLAPDPAFDDEDNDTADPVQRTFTIQGRSLVLSEGARTLTSVTVDGEAADPAATPPGYRTITHKGLIVALRFHHHHACCWWGSEWTGATGTGCECHQHPRVVVVTGRFGLAKIPISLREGIYTLAARKYAERNVNYADQVQLAEGQGTEVYYRQLPPATKLAFDSFALPKAIAGLA